MAKNFFKRIFSKEKSEKLESGMEKTREGVWSKISRAVIGKSKIDDEVLDDLEEAFITSDVGVETTLKIIDRIKERVARDKFLNSEEFDKLLCEEVTEMLAENKSNEQISENFELEGVAKPYVIMVVGVNGVGKTTTIGKLAHQYKQAGNNVVLGACDTFRAAAIEQLEEWGRRADVPVIKQKMGSDPSAVAHDTLSFAKSKNADVVIIDTAGRLHNKSHLMEELSKIKRVMSKVVPGAPNEVLLVLDGSTGQNAYHQAIEFKKATEINELAITKLDGTAKGGVVIGISDQLNIPIKYIGIGEAVEDLQLFSAPDFVKSIFTLSKK